uniref:Uncharacterized protein n=1 Tax=Ditylum brightwellii TaxID=49249 RepID=A0A7S4QME1_9STRA|mmetsp:Transcript_37259/g.49432  ORF Transcript_37259/g.49432 Transcript_37259/m.49432 type:complete len:283 (+) Transcript_37259:197-1045(+)
MCCPSNETALFEPRSIMDDSKAPMSPLVDSSIVFDKASDDVRSPAASKLDHEPLRTKVSTNSSANTCAWSTCYVLPSLSTRTVWESVMILLSLYRANSGALNECLMTMAKDYCKAQEEAPVIDLPGFPLLDNTSLLTKATFAFCLVDIILNFMSVHNKVSKQNRWSNVLFYVMTWFLIDLLNVLPWESFAIRSIARNARNKPNMFGKMFRVIRACPLIKKRWHNILRLRNMALSLGCKPIRHLQLVLKYIKFVRRMHLWILVRGVQLVRLMKRMKYAITESS